MNKSLPADYQPYSKDISEVMFTHEELQACVKRLGDAISADYAGQELVMIGVLKGVLFFMADLMRAVRIPVVYDFLAVSNYTPDTRNQGLVRLVKDLDISITDRPVIFVEDVIDTGLTLNYLLRNLNGRKPASLEVCSLFNKPAHRLIDIDVKYKGFDIPDKFIVGYGLDYGEQYRNFPFVGVLSSNAYKRMMFGS